MQGSEGSRTVAAGWTRRRGRAKHGGTHAVIPALACWGQEDKDSRPANLSYVRQCLNQPTKPPQAGDIAWCIKYTARTLVDP